MASWSQLTNEKKYTMKNNSIEKTITHKGRIAREIIDLLQTPVQNLTGSTIAYLFARICQMKKRYSQKCYDILNINDPDVPLYHQACNKFNQLNFLQLTERACDFVDQLENTEKSLKTLHSYIAHIKDSPLKDGITRFNKIALLTFYASTLNKYNEICDALGRSTLDSSQFYAELENNIFPQDDENNARFFNRRKGSLPLTRIYMKPLESYKTSWNAFDATTQSAIRKHVFEHFNHCSHLRSSIRIDPTFSLWIGTYLRQRKDQVLIDIYAHESDYPESHINKYLRTNCLHELIAATTEIIKEYSIVSIQQTYASDATPDLLAKRAILSNETLFLKLLSDCSPMFLRDLCQDTLFLEHTSNTDSIANKCFIEIGTARYCQLPFVNHLLEKINIDAGGQHIKDSSRPLTPGSASEN